MPRWRSGRLSSYGDWTSRRWARWRQSVAETAEDLGPMRDGDDPNEIGGGYGGREVRFLPRRAKPSAIGGGRRKADMVLP